MKGMKFLLIGLLAGTILTKPANADNLTVLELFTSQGCSSCPPADALMQELARDPDILALSYHVDYWDYLGWRDPFSLPESTQRQRNYNASLAIGVYTPQLVIDGTHGMVGSHRAEIEAALAPARQQPKPISITIKPEGEKTIVSLSVSPPVPRADIWLVTYNPQAVTSVRRGENSGRNLTSINNVKSIRQIGRLTQAQMQIDVPPAAHGDHVAVLVQDASNKRIIGAGKL